MNKNWKDYFITLKNYEVVELCKLSGSALKLYLILKVFRGANEIAWPSYTAIHEETGLSRDSISNGIKELVAAGIITYNKRFNNSNEYTFKPIEEKGHEN